MAKSRLWTRDFILVCISNFLVSFSFYILMPTIPFYLSETFMADKSVIGVVISCYTWSIMVIRPFSGYLSDTFPRKIIYVIAYFLFASVFLGYFVAGTLSVFAALRIAHGFTYGTISTSGSTLAIDVLPSERRGEGLGYFGVMNNVGIAIGPMVGLFIKDYVGFNAIFFCSIIAAFTGTLIASFIHSPQKEKREHQPISLDRFFLLKGYLPFIAMLLMGVPYGLNNTFVAYYAANVGILTNSGFYFTVLAVGLICSRILSGRVADRGKTTQMITLGVLLGIIGFLIEAFLPLLLKANVTAGHIFFYSSAILIGYGFGMLMPAMNLLFLNLAPNNRRATANATYLTAWDLAFGIGIMMGGYLSEHFGFSNAYFTGSFIAMIGTLVFVLFAVPYYRRHRVA